MNEMETISYVPYVGINGSTLVVNSEKKLIENGFERYFMSENLEEIGLGDRITVHTIPGKANTVISRLQDGRIILFDQNSQFFNLLAPAQIVECHVVNVKENYIIVSPISEPEEIQISYIPELEVDTIIVELEKLIEDVSGNAQVIPRALLRVIRLQHLIIKILRGEV